MFFNKKTRRNWRLIKGQPITEMDKRILFFQDRGKLCPSRSLIKTPEQIEGIRRSGVVNTGVLDLIEREIHEGMTTPSTIMQCLLALATRVFPRAYAPASMKWCVMAYPVKKKY